MGFKSALFIVSVLAFECAFCAVITEPILELKQGKIKGKLGESRNGRKFVQYLGIPYAQKPQRFQEAGPPEKWTGMRDGTKFGPACVQFDRKTKGVIGSEDCLFLNVYSPVANPTPALASTTPVPAKQVAQTSPKSSGSPTPPHVPPPVPPRRSLRKLPVLVYIHGGTFVSQSGQIFGPKYFMDEEAILVTLNYRLGALGFLSTGDNEIPANLGLRDQILALKWIQDNIENFGGDRTKVTLMGGSAGGAMASYLMLSPLAKGLFSRVISQSGNALCPWVIVRNPGNVARKLAAKLNCPTNGKTSKDIIACIKGKSLKDIEIARVALQSYLEDPAVPFAPVVEKWAKDKAVVPDLPQKLISEGKAGNIPWLTGYNSLNGLNLAVANILTTPAKLSKLGQDWQKLAPLVFHYSQTAPNVANVSDAIRQYYFGNGKISEESKEKLVIALTDRNYISCTAQAAIAQSKYAPVYLYTLSYQGASTFLDEWGVRDKIKMRGVVHNDELPFLFNIALNAIPEIKKGDKDQLFSEKMVKLWTEFARTGKMIERNEKGEREWSSVLPSQSTSSLRWYQLDSPRQSEASTITSPTFKVWEGLDLGADEGYLLRNQNEGKVVVGYSMTEKSAVKPITPPPLPLQPKPALSSQKPAVPVAGSTLASGNKPASGLAYGLSPLQASSTSSPTGSSSTTTLKSVASVSSPTPASKTGSSSAATAANPISGSSSTTTTTTPAPPVIHAVFKDDDPYSSTTTTTTKKPGFFSKILG